MKPPEQSMAFTLLQISMLILGLAVCAYWAFGDYLKAYNTQQDRIMFQKTYEVVLECRQKVSESNASHGNHYSDPDKICGQVPSFIDSAA